MDTKKKSVFSGFWKSSKKENVKNAKFKSCENLTEETSESSSVKRRWPSMRRSRSQSSLNKAKDAAKCTATSQLDSKAKEKEWVDFRRQKRVDGYYKARPVSAIELRADGKESSMFLQSTHIGTVRESLSSQYSNVQSQDTVHKIYAQVIGYAPQASNVITSGLDNTGLVKTPYTNQGIMSSIMPTAPQQNAHQGHLTKSRSRNTSSWICNERIHRENVSPPIASPELTCDSDCSETKPEVTIATSNCNGNGHNATNALSTTYFGASYSGQSSTKKSSSVVGSGSKLRISCTELKLVNANSNQKMSPCERKDIDSSQKGTIEAHKEPVTSNYPTKAASMAYDALVIGSHQSGKPKQKTDNDEVLMKVAKSRSQLDGQIDRESKQPSHHQPDMFIYPIVEEQELAKPPNLQCVVTGTERVTMCQGKQIDVKVQPTPQGAAPNVRNDHKGPSSTTPATTPDHLTALGYARFTPKQQSACNRNFKSDISTNHTLTQNDTLNPVNKFTLQGLQTSTKKSDNNSSKVEKKVNSHSGKTEAGEEKIIVNKSILYDKHVPQMPNTMFVPGEEKMLEVTGEKSGTLMTCQRISTSQIWTVTTCSTSTINVSMTNTAAHDSIVSTSASMTNTAAHDSIVSTSASMTNTAAHDSIVSTSASMLSPLSQVTCSSSQSSKHWSFSHLKDVSSTSYDSGVSQIGGQQLSIYRSSTSRTSTEPPSEPDMGNTTGIETDIWDSSDLAAILPESHYRSLRSISQKEPPISKTLVTKEIIARSRSHHDLRASKRAKKKEALLKSKCKSQQDVTDSASSHGAGQASTPCSKGYTTKGCPVHGDNAVFEGQPHAHLPRTKSLEMMTSTKKLRKKMKAAIAHGGSLTDIANMIQTDFGLHDDFRRDNFQGKRDQRAGNKDVSMAAESTFYQGGTLADKLRISAAEGNANRVVDYLNQGADFQPDREGRTAIHYASLNGYGHVVAILTNAGCDIDAQDNLGYTALHRAAAQGHLEVIHALLEEGCVLDRQDDVHGNAALHEAAWNGYSHTLEVLVKNKASVHLLNKQGFSALHLAAQNGHNQSARVLLYAGCDANLKNNYGDTPLHTATRYGHAGVTRILVSARSRLDEQNKNGDTALHIAAALKRRKIAKLLVEAAINISMRNKQNETAADVARRKQHPDIVQSITSQQKMLKDKKKQKKKSSKVDKLVVHLPEGAGEEKKEKKGFFFKKRNKSKDKLKDQHKQASGSSIEVKEEDDVKPVIRAGSDVSSRSSEFTSNATPQEMIRGFNPHPHACHPGQPGYNPNHPQQPPSHQMSQPLAGKSQARGTNTAGMKDSKAGYLSQYVPKQGVQYYKDLAGNVKQGPIGYTPVCTCAPQLKKLEQKMEADRDNLYDHIGHTHKMISEQINKIDQRCSQQVYTLDKMTRDRLDNDRKERDVWLNDRLNTERTEREQHYDRKHRTIKNEMQFHIDTKMTAFEKKYGHDQYCEGCDWCKRKRGGRGRKGRMAALDDDSVNYAADDCAAPMPGALVRAHSDETLSVSSSHPSRRNWKVRSRAMKELKDMNLVRVSRGAQRIESELCASTKRMSPAGALQPVYQEIPARRPTGRSPEGQADNQFVEGPNHYATWGAKRNPLNNGLLREFEEADGKQEIKLQVHDEPTKGMAKTAAQVHHTHVVSVGAVGAVAEDVNVSPSSYLTFNPSNSLNASTPKSTAGADTTGSSIDVDSFHQYASPQKPQPQQAVRAGDPMAGSKGYHQAIMSEWYGKQTTSTEQRRPMQPPPIGYGQHPRANTVYSSGKQQPQPQVPTTTTNSNNTSAYLAGKATQV